MTEISNLQEFLHRCSYDVRAFYMYWDAKRGNRAMPSRKDLDPPLETPRLISNILLVDVAHDPLRFTYRLVGTQLEGLCGHNLTGNVVKADFFGPDCACELDIYRDVVENKTIRYIDGPSIDPGGRDLCGECLFLPLSDDGQRVTMVLVYFDWNGQVQTTD